MCPSCGHSNDPGHKFCSECGHNLTEDVDGARLYLTQLDELGIDFDAITEELQRVGVEKFAKPFDSLMETLSLKRADILEEMATRAAMET